MKIAIIGSGQVGSTLGKGWREAGHEIIFGSRDPNSEKAESAAVAVGAEITTIAAAAAAADVVLLAVPWDAVMDTLRAAGNLKGKVVLDCINALTPDLSGLLLGHTTSAGEKIAAAIPGIPVVKIFNSTGTENMANPHYGDTRLTMLYAGDDEDAKNTAAALAKDIGFDPVDAGPLSAARLLESLAVLWIKLAYGQELGPESALQLIRRSSG